MKIPTYKRQTSFPTAAGAQPLSVQASPSAFGAPGAAMQQLGQTIQTEGLRWLDKEVKTAQATTQATSENSFNEWFATHRANLLDDDPANWKDVHDEPISARQRANQFENAAVSEAQRIAQGISNPTVRARALSNIRNKIYAAMPTVHQNVRGQYTDYSTSEFLKYTDGEEKRLANLPFGTPETDRAIEEHKKTIAYIAHVGEWDQKFHTQQQINSLERIDLLRFQKRFGQVTTSTDARRVINELDSGIYPNIGIDKLDSIAGQAERKVHSLLEKEQNALLRDQRIDEATRKKEEEFAYNGLYNRITIGRDQLLRLAQGEQLGTDETAVEVPTVMEIRQISERDMSVERKKKLIDAIEGRDAVQNERAIAYLEKQILESVAPQDLEALKTQIDQLYFNDRGIGAKGYDRLRQLLKDTKAGLPFVEQRKRYLTMLNRILTKASVMGGPAGATNNPSFMDINAIQVASAEEFFLKQLYDGVRPHRAFYEAIDRFVIDTRQNEIWQAAINGLPRDLLDAIGGVRGQDFQVSQEQISAAWAVWGARFDTEIPSAVGVEAGAEPLSIDELGALQRKKDGITQRERLNINQLYEEERILDGITKNQKLSRTMKTVADALSEARPYGGDQFTTTPAPDPANTLIDAPEDEAAVAEVVKKIENNLGLLEAVPVIGPLLDSATDTFDQLLESVSGRSKEDDPIKRANERSSRGEE